MITTTELIQTIRQANGETSRQTRQRIREAAVKLELMDGCEGHYDTDEALTSGVGIGEGIYCDGTCQSLPADWFDDDADEIAMAITR